MLNLMLSNADSLVKDPPYNISCKKLFSSQGIWFFFKYSNNFCFIIVFAEVWDFLIFLLKVDKCGWGSTFFFFFALTCFVLQIEFCRRKALEIWGQCWFCWFAVFIMCMCAACVWRLEYNTYKSVLWMWVWRIEFRSGGLAPGALISTEPSHWSKYIVLDLHHPIPIRKEAFWHSAWSENRILPYSQYWMIKRFPFFKKSPSWGLTCFSKHGMCSKHNFTKVP